MSTTEMTAGYHRNTSLDDAIVTACGMEGMHWFKCFRLRLALRRCTDAEHFQIDQACTKMLVESGVPLPVGATIVDGILDGDWKAFIEMIIAKLPEILDFLMKLLPFIISLF